MNYIAVVLFALVALALADEFKLCTQEDLSKARRECLMAKNVSMAHIEKYQKFDFPDDEVTRCYIECIVEALQLFNHTTGFNIDHLVAQLGQGFADKAAIKADVELCASKGEEQIDACRWAYRGFKCFTKKNLVLVQETVLKKL